MWHGLLSGLGTVILRLHQTRDLALCPAALPDAPGKPTSLPHKQRTDLQLLRKLLLGGLLAGACPALLVLAEPDQGLQLLQLLAVQHLRLQWPCLGKLLAQAPACSAVVVHDGCRSLDLYHHGLELAASSREVLQGIAHSMHACLLNQQGLTCRATKRTHGTAAGDAACQTGNCPAVAG